MEEAKTSLEQSETNLGVDTPNDASNPQTTEDIVDDASVMYDPIYLAATAPTTDAEVSESEVSEVADNTPKGSNLIQWLLWFVAICLTAVISATLGAALVLFTPLGSIVSPLNKHQTDLVHSGFQYRLSRPVNILVMGIDRVPNVPDSSPDIFNGRSDTMLLFRLDPKEGAAKMLSIPRDTKVEVANLSIPKINQANVDGGSTLAVKVVSQMLNDVPIDRYVRVSTGALRELVDLVGGLEIFVPSPMHYVDNTQNLHIDLEQGWQTLNGEQAEQFARFRKENGDIGRVQRQQALLKALRQRLGNPSVLSRLPQIVRVMWKYVDTNLSLEETLALANFGLGLNQDDLKMVMLPGRFSSPKEYKTNYWILNTESKDRLLREFFQQETAKAPPVQTKEPNQVRVAIQNASGDRDLSGNMVQYLARKGFKNVYVVEDWPDLQRQTQIIVQQGDRNAANEIKKVLGLGNIQATSTGDIDSELTIRLGKDWLEQQPQKSK